MQSSFTVFCRALVMLTCLVVLPLAAITGGTGRKVIVPLVERCLDLLRERPVEPVEHALVPPPPAGASSGQLASGKTARAVGQPLVAAPSGGNPAGGVYPASGGVDESVKESGSRLSTSWPQVPHRRQFEAGSLGQSEPAASIERTTGNLGPVSATPPQRVIEQRLRDLGATYYTLEKWGSSQRLYRFECRMAITTDPNYTRFFEATAERPLGAMEHVLAQVEAWRADRQVR